MENKEKLSIISILRMQMQELAHLQEKDKEEPMPNGKSMEAAHTLTMAHVWLTYLEEKYKTDPNPFIGVL